MSALMVNGAGILLAAFVVSWFWLSGPAAQDDQSNNTHNH